MKNTYYWDDWEEDFLEYLKKKEKQCLIDLYKKYQPLDN